jgi:hypothetical protein
LNIEYLVQRQTSPGETGQIYWITSETFDDDEKAKKAMNKSAKEIPGYKYRILKVTEEVIIEKYAEPAKIFR